MLVEIFLGKTHCFHTTSFDKDGTSSVGYEPKYETTVHQSVGQEPIRTTADLRDQVVTAKVEACCVKNTDQCASAFVSHRDQRDHNATREWEHRRSPTLERRQTKVASSSSRTSCTSTTTSEKTYHYPSTKSTTQATPSCPLTRRGQGPQASSKCKKFADKRQQRRRINQHVHCQASQAQLTSARSCACQKHKTSEQKGYTSNIISDRTPLTRGSVRMSR